MIHMGTSPGPLRGHTATTPSGHGAWEEEGSGKEECRMQKEEAGPVFTSDAKSDGYAIHKGALPEECWGNVGAGNGGRLSLARA